MAGTASPTAPQDTPTAAERRRRAQLFRTQRAAAELTITQGYDGFTMDDLAAAVDVSRRTLFNQVGDKLSAVLGPEELPDPHSDGAGHRPSATPFDALLDGALEKVAGGEIDDEAIAVHGLVMAAVAHEPKLEQEVARRNRRVIEAVAEFIRVREGWPDGDVRANILARTVNALFTETFERIVSHDDPTGLDFATEFRRTVEAFRSVLPPGR